MATVFSQTPSSGQTMSRRRAPTASPSPPSSSSTIKTPIPAPAPMTARQPRPSSMSALPTARKIRFAPLPDPRRSVLITDDGQELPLPDTDESAPLLSSSLPTPSVFRDALTPETASLSSVASSSKRNSDTADPASPSGSTTPASMTNTTNSEASGSEPNSPASVPACLPPAPPTLKSPSPSASPPSTSGWPKAKGISFFRAFKRSSSSGSSSNSLTPTNSIDPTARRAASSRKGISTEEIFTLGTINLFRASSRESGDGWNLTRWGSAGSSSAGPARNFGVPLTRTQSTQSSQSYKSKTPSLLSGLRPSSVTAPKQPKKKQPVRKGTRMLNGRVYGAKRDPNANPFANARDDEPSFVEWGYGGMGSVKGATSAGVAGVGWEKLGGTTADDDLEDATGTAWLRQRKEAREKKAREEIEAKERAAKGESESSKADGVETASSEAKGDGEGTLEPAAPPAVSESAVPTPTASSADLTLPLLTSSPISSIISPREIGSPLEEEHVFKTMTIPPRPHHRSRSASNATFTHAVVEVDKLADLAKVDESDSGSETGSESEREEDSSDEDEDAEAEEQRKKMVIGAGVEKVSWHRSEVEEHV